MPLLAEWQEVHLACKKSCMSSPKKLSGRLCRVLA